MLPRFLNQIISHGVDDTMDQFELSRLRRINLFYAFMITLLVISTLFSVVKGSPLKMIRDGSILTGTLLVFFLIPPNKKPDLNSMLGLVMLALLIISAFLIDLNVQSSLILAFYLLFPLTAMSLNGKHGLHLSIGLGIIIVLLNYIPGLRTFIHLGILDLLVFMAVYITILILSHHIEKSNRSLITKLKDSRSHFQDQRLQRDEFISKLSHKLRTSLSNITLINNLVHDIRLTSLQKELMDTLKASTDTLIKDVNNIVEIASPGIIDYKKSIISFDMSQIMEQAVDILTSGDSSNSEVTVEYSGRINQLLIGDPSLVRSLVINIIKGVNLYKQTGNPVMVSVETVRETPSQVRLKFSFSIRTDLGKELASYMDDLKRANSQKGSNLSTAHNLLTDSESELMISQGQRKATISFFQDFAKDATRSMQDIEEIQEKKKKKKEKKPVVLAEARVLLVEDNEINQRIVLLSLDKKVQQIDVAGNGKEALEMFGQKQYNIILMDIMMPVMDGLTATKKIREIESTSNSHIPIIAITANALTGDRDNCLAAGADEYIAKPFQADVLIKKMKHFLA